MQILEWLRKDSESLSARGRRQGHSQGQAVSRGWKLCKVLPSIVLFCCDAHFQISLPPIPSHLILFHLARKGKTVPKCFIPLVSVCLLAWLRSVTPFLKGLACFDMARISCCILIPHLLLQTSSFREVRVSGAFSAFDVILKTNSLIERSCFTHYYHLNPLC